MTLFFIYILFLVLENLLLPAIEGTELFLITPIFILAIIVNASDFKKAAIQLAIFSLVGELFTGAQIGSSLIPLLITAFVYFAIDHFIEISAGLDNAVSFAVILARSFVLMVLSYIYSWLFIFFGQFNGLDVFDRIGTDKFALTSIYRTWGTWSILLDAGAIITIFVWSCIFSAIFAYVLKKK